MQLPAVPGTYGEVDMELELKRADLMKSLAIASEVAPPKSPIPILKCVRMTAADGRLVIDASDNIVSCSLASEARVDRPGCVAVPAAQLSDLVRAMPDG